MADEKPKTWKNSKYKREYLKVAFLCLCPPSKVYKIAHQSHSNNTRERMIRARLMGYGVLRNNNQEEAPTINLEEKHI